MRKLLGAAAILLASLLAACLRLRAEGERLRLLRALSQSLLLLRSELSERQRGLSDCFCILAQKTGNDVVALFYSMLAEEMDALGEKSFAEIWRCAAGKCFSSQGESILELIVPLGACLGGSELARQCAALDDAARRLEGEEAAERERFRAGKKLRFALCLSAGAFLVIMLI